MTLNRWIAILIASAVLAFPTLSLADHHEAGEAAEESAEESGEEGEGQPDEASGDDDDEGSEDED